MDCPGCHAKNRDGRRFCAECGAPLVAACPICGTQNLPAEAFCGGCGKRFADDAVPAARRRLFSVPERRQLTVMFCDLVGSTALSHRLDPEDLRQVIRSYQEAARQVVVRYEGFVARYMGDGVLVYFGYPQAQEDAAARAVHAALDITEALDRLGPLPTADGVGRLRARIGIATGLVVVGDLIGEGSSQEAAAVGETPNLAARLQALADPDGVLVAETTRELAGGQFEYADQGVHELKGFDQPQRAWRVLRARAAQSRFDAARGPRMTPFVGRAHEIELLLDRWQRAAEGAGQVVLLSGEAGIGKSRIALTLIERIADSPHIVLRGQCSPYHANSALYPLIQQLERAAGFAPGDSVQSKLVKLETLLASSTPDSTDDASLFAALLSLPAIGRYPALELTPQQQKQKTLQALLLRVRALAGRAPLLLLLEDAHWIDPTSAELLELLVRETEHLAVLLIVTSRVRVDSTWCGLPHVSPMLIERLDRIESTSMVAGALEGHDLPAGVIAQIVAKTDGVPLFIEEVTKTLVSSSRVLRSEVPSTLQDSLMARLDQLGAAKEVAQIGAVIGREFSRDLIAALAPLDEPELDQALERLTSSAIVFSRGQPLPAAFIFKHALVQDAAYASLLRSKRQELHLRIAQTLETGSQEHLRTEPEVLALHYGQAGQALMAARYSAAAALRALDRSANLEALNHAAKGLDLLAGVVASSERDHLELSLAILQGAAYRAVKGFAATEVERSFARALELSNRLGDIPRLIEVRRGLFSCYYARGALAMAQQQGEHVAALGQQVPDRASQMLGYWMLGVIASWQGGFERARRELERAVALYDPNEQKAKTLASQIDPGVNALCHLSWVLWTLGWPDRAVRTSDEAVRTARKLAQPVALAMTLFFACETRACCGQHASASVLLDELLALTEEHGFGYLASCARILKGQELIARDDCAAGLAQVERALSEFAAQEGGLGLPWSMSISAWGYARLGRIDEGLAALARGFEAMPRNDERHWEAELWRLKGELLLLRPEPDGAEAQACFQHAIDVARSQAALSLELRAATSLARLLARQGDSVLARTMLGQLVSRFTEGAGSADLVAATEVLEQIGRLKRE